MAIAKAATVSTEHMRKCSSPLGTELCVVHTKVVRTIFVREDDAFLPRGAIRSCLRVTTPDGLALRHTIHASRRVATCAP